MSSAELSPERQQILDQFVDITNWDKDRSVAINLLDSSNWSLETAVALHFEGGIDTNPRPLPPTPSPPQQSRSSTSGSPRQRTSLLEELNQLQPQHDIAPRVNPNPPIYTPRGNGFSIIQSVLLAPFTYGYKVLSTLIYWLSMVFPFLPRLTGYYPANRNATRTGTGNVDPTSTAMKFILSFEERYGRNELPFFEGGYTEALEKAKTNLNYFVVILESPEHDLTDSFNREVLMNPQIVEFLKRDDITLWVGDVKESEAYQVASGLDVTKFPFMALIAPSPKTPTSNIVVMSVLARLRGVMDADTVISTIEEKMEEHQPKLMSLVLDKQERDVNRQLREEQQSAYERSLQADREREERLKREEEERRLQEEQEKLEREEAERKAQQAEEERQRLQRLKELWKRWRVGLIHEPKDGEKFARVSMRLLTGERVVRKFAESCALEDVYAFVECYDLLDKQADNALETKPEGYEHQYTFELVSPMPRKVLEPSKDIKVVDEKTIWPNGSLVVEIADDDDDDNDNDN